MRSGLIRPPIPGARNSNDRNYRQDRSDYRRVTWAGLRAGRRVPGPGLAGDRNGAGAADGARLGADRPGGPAAPLTIGQSIPGVVDTVEAQAGQGGLQYLDYQGRTVRW